VRIRQAKVAVNLVEDAANLAEDAVAAHISWKYIIGWKTYLKYLTKHKW